MIELVIAWLLGIGIGALLAWWAQRPVIVLLEQQLAQSKKAEETATDRLVHAWREGATIPPRPSPPPPPLEPLPPELQQELNDWEDGEHRAILEAQMRAGLAQGKSSVAILLELDNRHPA